MNYPTHKLTPGQARAIWELAVRHRDSRGPGRIVSAHDYSNAIAGLTAKPGNPAHCEGCVWWRGTLSPHGEWEWACRHETQLIPEPELGLWSPGPPPKVCPTGYWEEE